LPSKLYNTIEKTYETWQKNVKSHDFLDFEKNVKNVKNVEVITYAYSAEDHGDQPQSVLLSFAQ